MKKEIQEVEEPCVPRRETVRAGIIRRIRPTCPDLSEEEFLGLVEQMVDRQLEFEVKGILISSTKLKEGGMIARFVVTVACVFAVAACSGKPDTSNADSLSVSSSTATSTSVTNPDAPLTVRGAVASISATSIVVKTDTGNVTVALTAPFQVYARAPGKLADVKDNTFIGVTTVKRSDGAERATEIHVFPEELRGMGEGSRMMMRNTGGSASRMTNGAVMNGPMMSGTGAQSRMSNGAVANASDSTLVVQYAGGSTTVSVPRNTPVTELKATSKSLKPGDQVVVVAKKEADGSLSSRSALIVGK